MTVLVARVHGSPHHRRHRQKEGKLRRSSTRQAKQQATDDGRAGARSTRNHGQALHKTDFQRMAPAHLIDMRHLNRMLPSLGPEHDHPTQHQRSRHGDRVEQVLMNQVGEQYTQYQRWQKGQ